MAGPTAEIGSVGGAPEVDEPALDEVFDEVYRRRFRHIVAFFSRRGVDAETSRDLAQDVMLRAYRGFASFEARHVEKAQTVWLRRIAMRVWANWLRARRGTLKRSGDERSLDTSRESGFEVDAEQGLWNPRTVGDPERRVIEAQARDRIGSVLGELPPRQRECLELWLEGVAYREIGERLGTSLQTVRSSLHKAKANVRARLGGAPIEALDESPGGER